MSLLLTKTEKGNLMNVTNHLKIKSVVLDILKKEGLFGEEHIDTSRLENPETYLHYTDVWMMKNLLTHHSKHYEKEIMDSYWSERLPENSKNGYVALIESEESFVVLKAEDLKEMEVIVFEYLNKEWPEECYIKEATSLKDLLKLYPDSDLFYLFEIVTLDGKGTIYAQ